MDGLSGDSRASASASRPPPLSPPSRSPPPQPPTPTLIPPTPSPPPSPTSSRGPPPPRSFFAAWQLRNARRAALWHLEPPGAAGAGAAPAAPAPVPVPVPPGGPADPAPPTHLTTLHHKLQHLKEEIASLVAQDIALFRQLFSLQEAILELREQFELSSCSSGESSPCSTLSSSSSFSNLGMITKVRHSSSFVRHHVSYPPIARNRSYRLKSTAPHHGCQDSYDSGIHNSDHEIFV